MSVEKTREELNDEILVLNRHRTNLWSEIHAVTAQIQALTEQLPEQAPPTIAEEAQHGHD